ncbi:MAG: phytanoyl-CoA dioxygenase family protein [Proteobacteria bacterium]|nr:phytanoyl-CoA dioxygenase family protein [Pseudomonadota bacterium]
MTTEQATPTNSPAQARSDLDTHGIAIVTDVLSKTEVSDIRQRLFDAVEASEADGVPTRGYPFDPDLHNIRVFHLFNLDPVFVDLIQKPYALDFVRRVLGDDFLISNFSANITEPGNQRMALHADQGYVLPPWPTQPLACNVSWLLDDLNEENGGTRYVPGSHRYGHGPAAGESRETFGVEAPAGSIVIIDGRLWHQTGENRASDGYRAALFGYYALRWLRPQINWNTALWPETVARLEPSFLHLLGYYTGNTEFQVPNGKRAPLRAPAELDTGDKFFALAPNEKHRV